MGTPRGEGGYRIPHKDKPHPPSSQSNGLEDRSPYFKLSCRSSQTSDYELGTSSPLDHRCDRRENLMDGLKAGFWIAFVAGAVFLAIMTKFQMDRDSYCQYVSSAKQIPFDPRNCSKLIDDEQLGK